MAKKSRPIHTCSECGYVSPKWLGRCPDCGSWGTLEERAPVVAGPGAAGASASKGVAPSSPAQPITKIGAQATKTVRTSMLNYSVPEGELPKFFMTVTNPTAADCKIDLDKNLLRFEVYKMADNERVWSDTDCYASVQTGSQTFPAGKDVKFEAEWSRQASKPGECTDRPVAEPGAYFAHTVIGDNSSPPQDFTLR